MSDGVGRRCGTCKWFRLTGAYERPDYGDCTYPVPHWLFRQQTGAHYYASSCRRDEENDCTTWQPRGAEPQPLKREGTVLSDVFRRRLIPRIARTTTFDGADELLAEIEALVAAPAPQPSESLAQSFYDELRVGFENDDTPASGRCLGYSYGPHDAMAPGGGCAGCQELIATLMSDLAAAKQDLASALDYAEAAKADLRAEVERLRAAAERASQDYGGYLSSKANGMLRAALAEGGDDAAR